MVDITSDLARGLPVCKIAEHCIPRSPKTVLFENIQKASRVYIQFKHCD